MSVQLIEAPVAKNDPTKRANKKQTTSKSSVEDNTQEEKAYQETLKWLKDHGEPDEEDEHPIV